MSSVQSPAAQRFVLHNVDWQTYARLLRAFAGRPSVRLTYDRGTLEIMSPSQRPRGDAACAEPRTLLNGAAYLLGRFVDVLTEELNLPVKAGRCATFRRRRRRRGLESDNSYWIANESLVRGKDRIDLRVDPPPDLAVEVDVTHSSMDRLGIYAALGVPEIWRLADDRLTFHLLQPGSKYAEAGHSRAFPKVTPADLSRFLALRPQQDETTVIRQFRAWVRQHVVGPATP